MAAVIIVIVNKMRHNILGKIRDIFGIHQVQCTYYKTSCWNAPSDKLTGLTYMSNYLERLL